jgi:hypothetical protein
MPGLLPALGMVGCHGGVCGACATMRAPIGAELIMMV